MSDIKNYRVLFLLVVTTLVFGCQRNIPNFNKSDFGYVSQVVPYVILDIRYHSKNNFIGKRIDAYHASEALLTKDALTALKNVQYNLNKEGLGLKIFDAYRPQTAVNHFMKWAKVMDDTLMKSQYYPEVDKKDLFKLGYIAEKSGHSRGSTVDLTIVDLETKAELDMGSPFDYFGSVSHHNHDDISHVQKKNRKRLKSVMMQYGFKPYAEEWWHYTLVDEPFPDTYFSFPVKAATH